MNPVTDLVLSVTWILLLIWAIRSMSRGWSVDSNRPSGMWTTKVTKVQHPEMVAVKPGTELICLSKAVKSKRPELESLKI